MAFLLMMLKVRISFEYVLKVVFLKEIKLKRPFYDIFDKLKIENHRLEIGYIIVFSFFY